MYIDLHFAPLTCSSLLSFYHNRHLNGHFYNNNNMSFCSIFIQTCLYWKRIFWQNCIGKDLAFQNHANHANQKLWIHLNNIQYYRSTWSWCDVRRMHSQYFISAIATQSTLIKPWLRNWSLQCCRVCMSISMHTHELMLHHSAKLQQLDLEFEFVHGAAQS